MLAGYLLWGFVYILSKVELLSRVDLTTGRYLEVRIRYLAVSVTVETVKELLELFISQKQSLPMQIRFQFIWLNGSRLLLIEVREGFLECLPLKLDFLKHCLFYIHGLYCFIEYSLIEAFESLIDDFDVFIIMRVLHGVVAEVEALRLLNLSTHPLAKVSIVDSALSFLIFVSNKLGKVFKIEFLVLAPKVPQYILDSDEPVKVAVEVEERFADTSPVICELHLYQFFQILKPLLDS